MTRIGSLTIALAGSLLAMAPPAAAAQTGVYYTATALTKPAKATFVTRNTVWRCAETTCTASKATDRDTVLCELIARNVGTLTSFTVDGTTYGPQQLDKCNARAR